MVQPSFDLKPERTLCVWMDLVLHFMFHLVLFAKPEILGSDKEFKMKKIELA